MTFLEISAFAATVIGTIGTVVQTFFSYETWKHQRLNSGAVHGSPSGFNTKQRLIPLLLSKYFILLVAGLIMFLGQITFAGKASDFSASSAAPPSNVVLPTTLSIVGLSIDPPSESALFQVRIIANGKTYTLPRNGDWLAAHSAIRGQSVTLPPSARYAIQFELRKRDAYFGKSPTASLEGSTTLRYAGGQTGGTYSLRGFDTASAAGSGIVNATVAYTLAPAR